MQIYGGIFTMQLYWIHTSTWVISSKFAAYLQKIFSEQDLWRCASGHLHHNKKQGKRSYSDQYICFIPNAFRVLLCTHYQTILSTGKIFSYNHILFNYQESLLEQIATINTKKIAMKQNNRFYIQTIVRKPYNNFRY